MRELKKPEACQGAPPAHHDNPFYVSLRRRSQHHPLVTPMPYAPSPLCKTPRPAVSGDTGNRTSETDAVPSGRVTGNRTGVMDLVVGSDPEEASA